MTLKTWKAEFYPKAPSKRMSKLEAVQHSLLKWKGLTKANLNKHKVTGYAQEVVDLDNGKSLSINSRTCALCVKYYPVEDFNNAPCLKCPLFQSLGHRCDIGGELGDKSYPYGYYVWENDPKPMIKALEKTLKMVEREMG